MHNSVGRILFVIDLAAEMPSRQCVKESQKRGLDYLWLRQLLSQRWPIVPTVARSHQKHLQLTMVSLKRHQEMHKALFKRMLKADVLPLAHLHSVPFPYYAWT